jgi:hypothetical protein
VPLLRAAEVDARGRIRYLVCAPSSPNPMSIRRALPLVCLLAVPSHAHPGHGIGGGSHGVLHYLFEGPHALPWLLLASGALALAYLARRWSARR